MKIGLLIYGSLETISGGYLYDRKLVAYLRAAGEHVEIISLPRRRYLVSLVDNLTFRLPPGLDLLIQDELSHPSLLIANRRPHPYTVLSLVHHLRCCERHPAWQNRLYRWIERCYLRSVDGFIFNSKTTRDAVRALAGEDKPHCIAPPPTDRFGPALDPGRVAARAAEPGPLRIVFVGNLIRRKGLHVLLDALVLLPPDLVCLEVIGSLRADPAYAAAMQAKATRIATPIIFHGALDDRGLAERLRCAHVLVVPSAYEGFGIVYLEGMGFGLPAIGTTAGAAREVISHGRNGYLIPPDDAVQLAICLLQLATDRGLLAWMAQNALQRYNQQPRWQETAAQIHRFLRSF
jgi:Glycosyltransferase